MKTAANIIDDVIYREGRIYSNHAADRGGPTKYGITLATLREWRRRTDAQAITSAEDVKALTEQDARAIYAHMYFIDPGFSDLSDLPLQGLLVDCAVNHGVTRAVKWLQKALSLHPDGILGPITLRAANSPAHAGPLMRSTYASIVAQRIEFYGEIITNDPLLDEAKAAGFRLQAENALGWMRRTKEFVHEIAVL